MKKSIAMKLADALESGDYEQGTGQLRTKNNEWCCLGVLCNLHAQAHPKLANKQSSAEEYLGHESFLPIEVIKWAGMSSEDGDFNDQTILDRYESLADMNDSGESFKEISKFIRENYKGL